jgi:hypothetical protein
MEDASGAVVPNPTLFCAFAAINEVSTAMEVMIFFIEKVF